MASLWKQVRSPYWFACFTTSDGRRVKKSTKQTDRKKAMAICMEWSRAADLGRQGALTEAQARKVVAEIVELAGGQPLHFRTAREWLESWVEIKRESRSEKTANRYGVTVRGFLEHLGPRADKDLGQVTSRDIQTFRTAELASGKVAATCNVFVGTLSNAFNAARRQGLILTNPAEALEPLPINYRNEKEVFTLEQIAALLEAASPEWKGAILFAFYTGARLRDVALMRWEAVDLPNKVVRFVPQKTRRSGKEIVIPLHPELENHLLSLPTPDRGKEYLFPTLGKAADGTGHQGQGGLSGRFTDIMKKAKVVAGYKRRGKGKGRAFSSLTFHSLRHSFNSAMANAGVSQELRQKLAGHSSAGMNKVYTHHEMEPLRAAIGLIPSLQTPAASK